MSLCGDRAPPHDWFVTERAQASLTEVSLFPLTPRPWHLQRPRRLSLHHTAVRQRARLCPRQEKCLQSQYQVWGVCQRHCFNSRDRGNTAPGFVSLALTSLMFFIIKKWGMGCLERKIYVKKCIKSILFCRGYFRGLSVLLRSKMIMIFKFHRTHRLCLSAHCDLPTSNAGTCNGVFGGIIKEHFKPENICRTCKSKYL